MQINQSTSSSNKSIAVLPFVNMSADPENEYFSDGITEEIINALTLIDGLKVIARTSSFAFKNKNIDVRAIANQLGVGTILEGSVRRFQQKVRITAQLINGSDGSHLWSKNFDKDFEDIFALQDQVSLLIADQIRENFGHLEIPTLHHTAPTTNMDAYNLLLKGNFYLKRKDFEDIQRALRLFKEAIELDSNYSEAYASLGETYLHAAGFGILSTKEAHELARGACNKAISLQEENAKAHKVLAYIKLFYDWEWESAQKEYNRAIQYGLPDQNEFITYYYIFIDENFERAIEVAKQIIETDPIHAIAHWQLGLTYYFARRFEEAIQAFNSSLEIDPNFPESLRFRGLIQGILGNYNEAAIDINKSLALTSGEGLANIDMITLKILMGKKKEALSLIKKTEFIDSSDPAGLYALLKLPNEANVWLEKAYEERSVMMVTLKNFWHWDNLKEDPKFKKIYQRMNFPRSTKIGNNLQPISTKEKENNSFLSKEEIKSYLEHLAKLIKSEMIYLDPDLSLRSLAEKMGLHPNKLSWLINEHIGKSFNDYINSFRLELFKQKALDKDNSHLTLLGLAFDSGFNSKTTFNTYFKKEEGITPKAWVKDRRN